MARLALRSTRCVKGGERHLCAVRALDVNVVERVEIALELGGDLEDDVVLVELGKDGGDLALTEGVVKRVIDVLRRDAKP